MMDSYWKTVDAIEDDPYVRMCEEADYVMFYIGHTGGEPLPLAPRYEFLESCGSARRTRRRRHSSRAAVGGTSRLIVAALDAHQVHLDQRPQLPHRQAPGQDRALGRVPCARVLQGTGQEAGDRAQVDDRRATFTGWACCLGEPATMPSACGRSTCAGTFAARPKSANASLVSWRAAMPISRQKSDQGSVTSRWPQPRRTLACRLEAPLSVVHPAKTSRSSVVT